MTLNFYNLIKNHAEQTPDQIAIIDGEYSLTYKQLLDQIFVEQKKRIYNAFKNSDSDSVIKFKNVLNKIINE